MAFLKAKHSKSKHFPEILRFHFSLELNSIPFYMCRVSLYAYLSMDYEVLFISLL